ncbi:hypothetical protein PBV87_11125 [Niameybacter massiliensis]|uniref:Uncharacterized protein n=1 Tax=Holtiella tumoricola TaxID=3018743 RepID=A0AA42J1A6_9FIRM|nr:hypothetical protein [Holtiella tumoricola]MDA3732033.1 hypothetical protein [Holtiella tumoricola]
MNVKGEIGFVQDGKVKVFIKEKALYTNFLDVAAHIGQLQVNDKVIVAFYNNSLSEGAIIGKV